MIHVLTYATDGTNETKNLIEHRKNQTETLRFHGFTSFLEWEPTTFAGTPFFNVHRDVLSRKRGAGYWLWKPYCIFRALNQIPVGDVLMYLDADLAVVKNPTDFANQAIPRGVMATGTAYPCITFVKRDVFVLLDADTEYFYNQTQIWAGALAFHNVPKVVEFVIEWLTACCNHTMVVDGLSKHGTELPGFFDHRHDQAVLTILMHKLGWTALGNEWAQYFSHPSG